jgi:hypothetical protein
LSDRLSQHLYGFGHNGLTVRCAVVSKVSISPEGYGYALTADKTPAGILLFGHRDMAYLHVERGSISLAESLALPGRGMVNLLRETAYVLKDELRAAAAIFAAGESFRDKPLLKLVAAPELSRLQQGLRESRQLVWQQLQDELVHTSLRSQERVICGGGNSYYWKPELKATFGTRLSFAGNLLTELQARFPTLKNDPLLPRCADCYRFWLSLPGMSELPQSSLALARR